MTAYQRLLQEARPLREKQAAVALVLKPYGLSLNQWLLLGLVHDKQPIGPTELARNLGTTGAYVTIALKQLEKSGLIVRQAHDSDGRSRKLLYKGGDMIDRIEADIKNRQVEI